MSDRELPPPEGATAAETADQALELMRVWWVGAQPQMTLRPALKDPKNVGRLLAEAAHHFSQVYASRGDGEPAELLAKIAEGWEEGRKIPIITGMTKPGA